MRGSQSGRKQRQVNPAENTAFPSVAMGEEYKSKKFFMLKRILRNVNVGDCPETKLSNQ